MTYSGKQGESTRCLDLEFDFNEWKQLHEQDPAEFEANRQMIIEQIIANAAPDSRRRLKGIMFRIDSMRESSKNPLQACMHVSQMMWQSMDDLRHIVNLSQTGDYTPLSSGQQVLADVVELNTSNKTDKNQ